MGLDCNKVVVQYNAVDSTEILEKAKEDIDLVPNKTLQMVTIGRLEKQKGYSRLLECLGKLKKRGYDFGLWILGEGTQRRELEELIVQFNMENNVFLLGFKDNPYKYLNKCDVFVCSSYAEGFSTVATEAIILGKPVFTTNCAGMYELFNGESCGQIVNNTDKDLYKMLENLISGKININDYQDGISRCRTFFDIKQRMLEIENLFSISNLDVGKKVKIMFMMNSLHGGGAEKVFLTLLHNLDYNKYDVTVYSMHNEIEKIGELSKKIHYKVVFEKQNFIKSRKKGRAFMKLSSERFYKKYFCEETYDIEVAFIEGESTKIISGSNNANSKKLAWVHIDLVNNPWTEFLYNGTEDERNHYEKFDKIVCVSQGVRNAFLNKFVYGEDKCVFQ